MIEPVRGMRSCRAINLEVEIRRLIEGPRYKYSHLDERGRAARPWKCAMVTMAEAEAGLDIVKWCSGLDPGFPNAKRSSGVVSATA